MGFLLKLTKMYRIPHSELKILAKIYLGIICTHMVDYCRPGHICNMCGRDLPDMPGSCLHSGKSLLSMLHIKHRLQYLHVVMTPENQYKQAAVSLYIEIPNQMLILGMN